MSLFAWVLLALWAFVFVAIFAVNWVEERDERDELAEQELDQVWEELRSLPVEPCTWCGGDAFLELHDDDCELMQAYIEADRRMREGR